MKWTIHYANGKTFSSEHGTFKRAPARGIVVIVQDSKEHISEIVSSADFYVWWNNRWQGLAHIYDLWDYAIETNLVPKNSPPSIIYEKMDEWVDRGLVKIGRMVTQDQYNLIMREANIEKTGWSSWERRP